MRTNIDIDDKLMRAAMKATGAATKKGAVEAAMRLTIQLHKQGEAIRKLRGIGWKGDLNAMRAGRSPQPAKQPSHRPAKPHASAA